MLQQLSLPPKLWGHQMLRSLKMELIRETLSCACCFLNCCTVIRIPPSSSIQSTVPSGLAYSGTSITTRIQSGLIGAVTISPHHLPPLVVAVITPAIPLHAWFNVRPWWRSLSIRLLTMEYFVSLFPRMHVYRYPHTVWIIIPPSMYQRRDHGSSPSATTRYMVVAVITPQSLSMHDSVSVHDGEPSPLCYSQWSILFYCFQEYHVIKL
jgi:hypothetical protein